MTLSFCIACKNRSIVKAQGHTLYLFPNCVQTINEVISKENIDAEIVIVDYHSDDWPLENWIPDYAPDLTVRIIQCDDQYFSIGKAKNMAAREARGDYLFFTDTDMLMSRNLITIGLREAGNGNAFFPVCWSYSNPEHTEGWWRKEGWGNAMMTKDLFLRTDGFEERDSWGREDQILRDRIREITSITRYRIRGFYHQWHPNDKKFKVRYYRHNKYWD